jgi:hypothetical protein
METFHDQNFRMTPSPKELREAQTQFRKEYTEKYLALDSTAWWWYWDVEREAQIFNLLSPAELQLLHKEIFEYGNSVVASKNAVEPLWKYLSSRSYTLGLAADQKISDMTSAMTKDLVKANQDRNNHVYNISQLFAHSVHRRPRKGLFQRIFKP